MEKVIDQEHRLTEVEQRSKSNTHRLDEMEKRQDAQEELVSTVAVLANRQGTVEADVKEIKTDVKKIAGKPGQRWEAIVDKALMLLVAAVIGFMLAKFGL